MANDTLAIDFGTSNSAAAMVQDGRVHRLAIETDAETVPTAVFFPLDKSPMRIGADAAVALIGGEEGRYMRALKSVLGTSLFHEQRTIGGRRRTLADIVTAFLVEVKARAEAAAGRSFTRVLSGRPVHFHTADLARDAKAEADLRGCYIAAGFTDVSFMFEPEAAALATHGLGQPGELGLIVDIGGGTSDFSVFQTEAGRVRILASHGIRLGGTDFDQAVSMAHAMPRLGYGAELRREMGPGLLPVPNHLYVELATWAKIPFLYTPDTRAEVAKMVKLAVKPRLLRRLSTVLSSELGHELAFAVEHGKINANAGREGARIRMDKIEADLAVPISQASLNASLDRYRDALREAAAETCDMAGVGPQAIGTVILVGGSSLMGMVAEVVQGLCPKAALQNSEPFTAVVDGLALATQAAAMVQ